MRQTIKASEGRILTNGETYGTVIHLAEGVDASTFHEITLEEYEAMIESECELNVEGDAYYCETGNKDVKP